MNKSSIGPELAKFRTALTTASSNYMPKYHFRKRKRSKGRMCCIVFLRNASVFLNYLIVVAAFVAGVMMIYVYLSENDTEVENIKNTFYTFRATVIFYLILAILVSLRRIFLAWKALDHPNLILGYLLRYLHALCNVFLAIATTGNFCDHLQRKIKSSTSHLFPQCCL